MALTTALLSKGPLQKKKKKLKLTQSDFSLDSLSVSATFLAVSLCEKETVLWVLCLVFKVPHLHLLHPNH